MRQPARQKRYVLLRTHATDVFLSKKQCTYGYLYEPMDGTLSTTGISTAPFFISCIVDQHTGIVYPTNGHDVAHATQLGALDEHELRACVIELTHCKQKPVSKLGFAKGSKAKAKKPKYSPEQKAIMGKYPYLIPRPVESYIKSLDDELDKTEAASESVEQRRHGFTTSRAHDFTDEQKSLWRELLDAIWEEIYDAYQWIIDCLIWPTRADTPPSKDGPPHSSSAPGAPPAPQPAAADTEGENEHEEGGGEDTEEDEDEDDEEVEEDAEGDGENNEEGHDEDTEGEEGEENEQGAATDGNHLEPPASGTPEPPAPEGYRAIWASISNFFRSLPSTVATVLKIFFLKNGMNILIDLLNAPPSDSKDSPPPLMTIIIQLLLSYKNHVCTNVNEYLFSPDDKGNCRPWDNKDKIILELDPNTQRCVLVQDIGLGQAVANFYTRHRKKIELVYKGTCKLLLVTYGTYFLLPKEIFDQFVDTKKLTRWLAGAFFLTNVVENQGRIGSMAQGLVNSVSHICILLARLVVPFVSRWLLGKDEYIVEFFNLEKCFMPTVVHQVTFKATLDEVKRFWKAFRGADIEQEDVASGFQKLLNLPDASTLATSDGRWRLALKAMTATAAMAATYYIRKKLRGG